MSAPAPPKIKKIVHSGFIGANQQIELDNLWLNPSDKTINAVGAFVSTNIATWSNGIAWIGNFEDAKGANHEANYTWISKYIFKPLVSKFGSIDLTKVGITRSLLSAFFGIKPMTLKDWPNSNLASDGTSIKHLTDEWTDEETSKTSKPTESLTIEIEIDDPNPPPPGSGNALISTTTTSSNPSGGNPKTLNSNASLFTLPNGGGTNSSSSNTTSTSASTTIVNPPSNSSSANNSKNSSRSNSPSPATTTSTSNSSSSSTNKNSSTKSFTSVDAVRDAILKMTESYTMDDVLFVGIIQIIEDNIIDVSGTTATKKTLFAGYNNYDFALWIYRNVVLPVHRNMITVFTPSDTDMYNTFVVLCGQVLPNNLINLFPKPSDFTRFVNSVVSVGVVELVSSNITSNLAQGIPGPAIVDHVYNVLSRNVVHNGNRDKWVGTFKHISDRTQINKSIESIRQIFLKELPNTDIDQKFADLASEFYGAPYKIEDWNPNGPAAKQQQQQQQAAADAAQKQQDLNDAEVELNRLDSETIRLEIAIQSDMRMLSNMLKSNTILETSMINLNNVMRKAIEEAVDKKNDEINKMRVALGLKQQLFITTPPAKQQMNNNKSSSSSSYSFSSNKQQHRTKTTYSGPTNIMSLQAKGAPPTDEQKKQALQLKFFSLLSNM